MQTQKSTHTNRFYIPLLFLVITLVSAACNDTKPSDLQRPLGEVDQVTNSITQSDNSSLEEANSSEENGQVAGIETEVLPPLSTKIMKINNINVEVEIADTDDSRAQGLSDRKSLADGKGMLFDFRNTDYKKPGFWMKDMLISIDMVWIKNGKIIGITPNVPIPPNDKDLELYYPPSEVSHVLEVPASWSAKNNLKVGDVVQL